MAEKDSTYIEQGLTLGQEEVRAIRRALLVGLDSYGEIERLRNGAVDLAPRDTGSPETVSDFAMALVCLEA